MLAAGRCRDPPAPSVLAVADPGGDLPHARVEGHLIADIFDAGDILVGGAATRGAVTAAAGRHPYVHVASHGAHSWDDALASTLTLAGGEPLTLGEINAEWRLDAARLVVLSACETGLTELGRVIDEYVGLPAGLLRAGAATVITTLWTVDDATTALLMASLYRRHLRCGQDSASALRDAQRWLRDLDRGAALAALEPARDVCARRLKGGDAGDVRMWAAIENFRDDLLATRRPNARPWAAPYYWAGFVHVGASQPGQHAAVSGSP